MIRAVCWFCADHYGVFTPAGGSWQKGSPRAAVASDVLALVGRPVNYYSRMTTEARYCLCAASVALGATPWRNSADSVNEPEIGLLSGSADGCLAADQEYFRDYVAEGRSLGRGNLFIYTLPTSVLGELAIVLSLTGPSLFIHEPAQPLPSLVRRAQQLIADGEADAMLALWSDSSAAVCFAVENGPDDSPLVSTPDASPLQLAREFQLRVQHA
jgi:3-oxoacyl-(acyl-carrier-protein) synthase